MARILAVSSGGGHWEQLMIVSESFRGHDVVLASTLEGLGRGAGGPCECILSDCNRNRPIRSLKCAWDTLRLVHRSRPDFVITTGAAPGLFSLFWGKLFGARTVWIDSVANSERLSMSGKIALKFADLHLTQWEHLAGDGAPRYQGNVL